MALRTLPAVRCARSCAPCSAHQTCVPSSPPRSDPSRYLAPGADRAVRNTYKLLAVLVHSGGVHGGHYYAFIRCVCWGQGLGCVAV